VSAITWHSGQIALGAISTSIFKGKKEQCQVTKRRKYVHSNISKKISLLFCTINEKQNCFFLSRQAMDLRQSLQYVHSNISNNCKRKCDVIATKTMLHMWNYMKIFPTNGLLLIQKH
jgi:hypothetical protein